jgi:hypothetical protein
MIVYFLTKGKPWRRAVQGLCVGLGLLGLGYGQFVFQKIVSGHQYSVQVVKNLAPPVPQVQAGQGKAEIPDHAFVASKRGTYYYPSSCSKARTLSTSNMLYFKDISAAEAAGYKAYSGC